MKPNYKIFFKSLSLAGWQNEKGWGFKFQKTTKDKNTGEYSDSQSVTIVDWNTDSEIVTAAALFYLAAEKLGKSSEVKEKINFIKSKMSERS